MSVADESTVPHRPPQVGDRVEVRLVGTVTGTEDGVVACTLDEEVRVDDYDHMVVERPADQVAILRDIPRYRPGHADRP